MSKINRRGSSLLLILVFGGLLMTILTSGVAVYGTTVLRHSKIISQKTEARSIAMAGITYYKWVLQNDPGDYWDGNPPETPGPYVHEYKDKLGDVIGSYSLEITPPSEGEGSTIITSTGWLHSDPNQTVTLRGTLSSGSFAMPYVIAVRTVARLYPEMAVSGKVHANYRVLCNTQVNNTISAGYANHGVYGTGGPQSFWEYPVPEYDFVGLKNDGIAKLVALGTAPEGMVIQHSNTEGGRYGWHIDFQADGTFDLYRVTQRGCYCKNLECSYQYCYDIAEEVFFENRNIPPNGVIIVDDNTYISGVVNGRVSILAGQIYNKTIYIPDSITYLDKSGDHVLGIFGRTSIFIPKNVPDVMEINAVIMNPSTYSIQRRQYSTEYADAFRSELNVYGSLIAYYLAPPLMQGQGNLISGFLNSSFTYDEHITDNPPPGFLTNGSGNGFTLEEID